MQPSERNPDEPGEFTDPDTVVYDPSNGRAQVVFTSNRETVVERMGRRAVVFSECGQSHKLYGEMGSYECLTAEGMYTLLYVLMCRGCNRGILNPEAPLSHALMELGCALEKNVPPPNNF